MDDRATIKIIDVDADKKISLDSLAANLGVSKLIIGTSDEAHIKVENPKVSPQHGYFYKQNGMWAFQDTNSTTGSSVKGARIESTWLANGMRLVLDSRLNLDSLIIDVEVEINSGRALLPGELQPEGWTDPASSGPTYGGAFTGAYYGNQGPASGGAGPRLGYATRDRYEGRPEPKFANGLNIFGLLAGILWAIVGVVSCISVFKTFSAYDGIMDYIGGFYKFLLWMIILGVGAAAVGSIVLAVGLFTYNKDVMSKGSIALAAGYAGVVVAILILLTESIGGLFVYIFSSVEVVLMIIAIILMPISLGSQAKNFKDNKDLSKIHSRFYRPILYYGIAFMMIVIAAISMSKKYGVDINFFELMPSSNMWISLAWVGAIVFSGVYLHIDENPALASRYSMGAK